MDTLETLRQAWSGVSAPQVALLVAGSMWVQEEMTLASAGLLSGFGDVPLWACLVGALGGLLAADTTTFVAGRYFGARVLDWTPVRRFLGKQTGQGRELFEKRGVQVVFAARFIPGSRSATFLLAGAMGMPWPRFLATDLIAACLWVPLLPTVALLAGPRILTAFEALGANPWTAAGVTLALVLVTVKAVKLWSARKAARAQPSE